MKFKTTIFLSVALLLLLSSCRKDIKTTPKGYEFKMLKYGTGETVKPGEVLILDMVILDSKDSAWYDNRPTDYPEMVRIADASKMESERGISEVFRMLSEGDSIAFKMRAKDVFLFMWKMNVPYYVDPESDFTYHVKARKVLDEKGLAQFVNERDSIHALHEKERLAAEEEERRKMEAELEVYNKTQLGKDTVLIDNYLKSKNVNASKLPNGLRYILKAKGEGPTAVDGDVVNMKYSGQLLDGTEFDAGEYAFLIGRHDVIKGWELIATQMKKGTVMTVFMPSTLCYGRSGRGGKIGPDAILVFEMELLGINKKR